MNCYEECLLCCLFIIDLSDEYWGNEYNFENVKYFHFFSENGYFLTFEIWEYICSLTEIGAKKLSEKYISYIKKQDSPVFLCLGETYQIPSWQEE